MLDFGGGLGGATGAKCEKGTPNAVGSRGGFGEAARVRETNHLPNQLVGRR